jgi:hypothetical protein
MSKICIKCGIDKNLSEFHIDNKAKDKHKPICKICRSKKTKLRLHLPESRNKFDKNIGAAIYRSIKTNITGKWERILGITLVELKKHLEKQFTSKMNWENYGSYWWIDKIIPRSAYRYQNVKNNEFHKCWSLKNLRPLPKFECVRKGNKVFKELIDQYNLYDIMPLGLIIMDSSSDKLLRNELEILMKKFIDKLWKQKDFDKDLYIRMMDISTSWNKAEILGIMVDKIRVMQDYNEIGSNFEYGFYIDLLLP